MLAALSCLTVFALTAYGLVMKFVVGVDIPVNSWVMSICAAFFGPIGFWAAGVALAHPVALRLNKDGASGYALAPLEWREVRKVGMHVVSRYDADATNDTVETRFLGFQLFDRESWWERNSPMQRWLNALRGKQNGWDVLLPLAQIETDDPDAVVDLAADLHEGRERTGQMVS